MRGRGFDLDVVKGVERAGHLATRRLHGNVVIVVAEKRAEKKEKKKQMAIMIETRPEEK